MAEIREYRGQEIVLTRDGTFQVRWATDVPEEPVTVETFREAKELIDATLKSEKLNLPILVVAGGEISEDVIVGVHRGTSAVRLKGGPQRGRADGFSLVARPALEVLLELRRQVDALEEALAPHRVPLSMGYGHVELAEWDEKIRVLKDRWSRASEAPPVDVQAALATVPE